MRSSILCLDGSALVQVFDLREEQRFDSALHVERVLGAESGGDFSVACWEPGQISPYHCHPWATEIYFCFEGGGQMHAPPEEVAVRPGTFVVHPPGELHEYENGARRTLLFRVRYGTDVSARIIAWRGNDAWTPTPQDLDYLRRQAAGGSSAAAVVDACRRHLRPEHGG